MMRTLIYSVWAGAAALAGEVSREERAEAVEALAVKLETKYSVPELGRRMAARLRERASAGAYGAAGGGEELARLLTADLYEVGRDLHLRVAYSAAPLAVRQERMGPPPDFRARLERANFGVAKVEILPGNIGYVDLRFFAEAAWAAETYQSVFGLVAHTDALIVDLRENRGSMSFDAVPLFSSYLFAEPVHLVDFYWRPTGETRQSWTYAYVPGRRYLDKPVYLLTSGKTFSGAEEFALDLQALKRAAVVGETTGGGANPGGTERLTDHFSVWLPVGVVTNAVTKGNWEGTGVEPDVKVEAARALEEARRIALRKMLEAAREEERREALLRELKALDGTP